MLGLKRYFKQLIFMGLFFCYPVIAGERWLSLDYCSDYYLYRFVAPQNIVGMSGALMDPNFSHMRPKSLDNVKQHHNRLEMIIMLNPDKILLSALAPAVLKEQLIHYGFDVKVIPYVQSWDGIKENNRWFGTLVEQKEIADRLNAKIDQAVAQAEEAAKETALFVGGSDFAIYQGTHYDLILQLLGFSSYDDGKQAYNRLNREEFILAPSDVLIDLQSMHMAVSQLGDLQGFDFLKALDTPPKRAALPLSYGLCPNDQLIDAATVIKEQLP